MTTPFLPYLLLNSLEKRYEPIFVEEFPEQHKGYDIVVLGSGYTYNKKLPPNSQLNQSSLGRIVEGVRLFYHLPDSRIIASGPYNNQQISQAEVVKKSAMGMGVPEGFIVTQSEPGNTYEEAKIYYDKFYNGRTVIVVTSAAHMHRAIEEFRRSGVEVYPSPANFTYRSTRGLKWSLIPSYKYIDQMETSMIEYAALFRNYLRDL